MQYSTNLNMNKPERSDQYNIDHWNDNTDILDTQIQNIKDLNDATLKASLLDFCYPIGSLYWSSQSTNPHDLFGGTWTQIKDTFIWAKGDSDTVNATGGAKTVTLEIANLPSHDHTFTPSGTISGGSYSFSGTKTTTVNGGAWSFAIRRSDFSSNPESVYAGTATSVTTDSDSRATFDNGDTSKTRQVVSHSGHTHEYTPSGSVSVLTNPTFSGTTGTTGDTGNGTAIDKMPPFTVKYCWERTA